MFNKLFTDPFKSPAGSPIRELFQYMSRPGMISFAGGYPSSTLFDAPGLAQAAQAVFTDPKAVLQYGPTEGQATLKDELLCLCVARRIACAPEEMLVTTGSQQAFDLVVRVLVSPGDTVLLETPAYPAAIQALRLAGANILEIPMDSEGLQTSALRDLLLRLPTECQPKLLYTVASFSNPRGTLLPMERRFELIELARQHRFAIIEDDPYSELIFKGDKPQAIYALAAQGDAQDNPVVYLSSLSKTVAPALRIGWMVADAGLIRRCAVAKQTVDLCTSPITQLIAAKYLQSGRYQATVTTAREEYSRRVGAMTQALRSQLGGKLQFDEPTGGMFLWVQCIGLLDPQRLFAAAVEQGVLFVPGAAFHPSPPGHVAMRLSFATPSVDEIREGVVRLARAFHFSTISTNALS